jgi:hypothetical protein
LEGNRRQESQQISQMHLSIASLLQTKAVYGLSDNVYSPPMTFGLTTTIRF